ncbi:MAG TPA: hypothetical protein VL200_02685 [Lacunisphaera sp.]|nr:hypothetical protein [Lacunisphaera sp.]
MTEAALTMLVLALGLGLVLTLADRARQRQKRERYILDVRGISAVFADYQRRHKAWPPGTSNNQPLPAELADALRGTAWAQGSPFGGEYRWIAPAPNRGPGRPAADRGAVALCAFAPGLPLDLDRANLLAIDRQIDDGDLATGRFRTGFNGWPVFFVEEAKP